MKKTSNKIKVFVGYHNDSEVLRNKIVTPIFLGSALSETDISIQRDDAGENISKKNKMYNEITGLYWMWKNTSDCDYVGFFHYRRHLILRDDPNHIPNEWGLVDIDAHDYNVMKNLGLDERNIRKLTNKYDIILGEKWDVRNGGQNSMYEHYSNWSSVLHRKDLDEALSLVKEYYPEYESEIENSMHSPYGYFTNIFIMKKYIFDKYCEWLFPLLFELEKRVDFKEYNIQEYRFIGYISEWLFTIYFNKLEAEKTYNFKHFKRSFFLSMPNKITPLSHDSIPIVLCGDENFIPHINTTIASIVHNTDKKTKLDVIIIGENYTINTQNHLRDYSNEYDNLSIRTYAINAFDDIMPHMHFNKFNYYRLLLSEILNEYDKVIYLDGDIVVLHDIKELYETSLGGCAIAACECYAVKAMLAKNVPAFQEIYQGDVKDYMEYYVGLSTEGIETYFNSGVMLLDLDKMRRMKFSKKMEKYLEVKNGNLWFVDQDLMNYVFQRNYKVLDSSWNVMNMDDGYIKEYLPAEKYFEYVNLKKKAKIIHYAGGEEKPWINLNAEFASLYWKYLKMTPWYEFVLSKNISGGFDLSVNTVRDQLINQFNGFQGKLDGVQYEINSVNSRLNTSNGKRMRVLKIYKLYKSLPLFLQKLISLFTSRKLKETTKEILR